MQLKFDCSNRRCIGVSGNYSPLCRMPGKECWWYMPESSNSPTTSSDRASEMGHHDPAAQQSRWRRLRSWLSGIPPMVLGALLAALATGLVGAVFGKAIYV